MRCGGLHRGRTGRVLALAALLTLGGLATATHAQQGTAVSPQEMRVLAVQAIGAGQPARGLAIAEALLQRDPDDPDALVLRARALRDLGRNAEAVAAARAAWAVADTPDRQYVAATVMAQALSSNGNRTRAQLWLRRAAGLAPTARHRAASLRDFAYVRSRNPLQLTFGLSVAPSSNINNGSIYATSPLFGWPIEFDLHGTARALSGMQVSANLGARYKLVSRPDRIDELTFRLHHTGYTLSREARDYLDSVAADTTLSDATRAEARNTRGSDFNTTTTVLGYAHTGINAALRGPYTAEAAIGQTWYGGNPLLRFARLSLHQSVPVNRVSRATFGITREIQQGLGGRADAAHWTTRAGYERVLAGGHRVSLGVDHTRAGSASATLAYTQTGVQARIALARPVLNMALEFGLSAARKHYPVSPHAADGRRENTLSADLTATFRQIEFYGFSPALTVSYSRTRANVRLYDREGFGMQLGVRSAF